MRKAAPLGPPAPNQEAKFSIEICLDQNVEMWTLGFSSVLRQASVTGSGRT